MKPGAAFFRLRRLSTSLRGLMTIVYRPVDGTWAVQISDITIGGVATGHAIQAKHADLGKVASVLEAMARKSKPGCGRIPLGFPGKSDPTCVRHEDGCHHSLGDAWVWLQNDADADLEAA